MSNNRLRDFVFANDSEPKDSQKNSETTIALDKIHLPSNQPRRYFERRKLQELAKSIETHGILEPLLVRKLSDGTFELVAGERRLRASKMLGLKDVSVIIRDLSDEAALEIALIENLQREDLNPLEETNGILQLLSVKLHKEIETITALLHRMMREETGKTGEKPEYLVMGTDDAKTVISIFDSLGMMNWQSFVANRLPLLNLPEDIQETLVKGQIAYTKALAISRLKEQKQRQQLLEEAISSNLSLSVIRQRIKELTDSYLIIEKKVTLKSQMDSVYKKLKQGNVWQDETKRKKAEKLLKQLEKLAES